MAPEIPDAIVLAPNPAKSGLHLFGPNFAAMFAGHVAVVVPYRRKGTKKRSARVEEDHLCSLGDPTAFDHWYPPRPQISA